MSLWTDKNGKHMQLYDPLSARFRGCWFCCWGGEGEGRECSPTHPSIHESKHTYLYIYIKGIKLALVLQIDNRVQLLHGKVELASFYEWRGVVGGGAYFHSQVFVPAPNVLHSSNSSPATGRSTSPLLSSDLLEFSRHRYRARRQHRCSSHDASYYHDFSPA